MEQVRLYQRTANIDRFAEGDLIFWSTETSAAPSTGLVLETTGAVSTTSTTPSGVSEKSSTERPSSAPGLKSVSAQRTQKEAPFGMLRPVMVKLIAVRFGSDITVQRANRARDDRAGKIEAVVVHPGAGGQTGSIRAELEVQAVR